MIKLILIVVSLNSVSDVKTSLVFTSHDRDFAEHYAEEKCKTQGDVFIGKSVGTGLVVGYKCVKQQ